MTLSLDFTRSLGSLDLAVAFDAPPGAVTAVLGPNGAGKTSLLRAVAGHLPVDTGSIVLDGVVLDAPPTAFVAPQRRRIGMVHQDHLLFPHLSAVDNVAFGPRAQGRSKRDARAAATALLERVGVGALAEARPGSLSGGEAQRVALARALAADASALLLDEPLSALDAGTRVAVRRDLRRALSDLAVPTLLVTHDPVDALALADHVAILEAGRITQVGAISEVAARPRSRYVADLIGTNLVHGIAVGVEITTESGARLILAEPLDGAVFATIAPAAIALHRSEPEGSPRNRWHTTVMHLDRLGDRVRVQLAPPLSAVAEITPTAAHELDLREGEPIWASVKATEVVAYPR